MKAALLFALLFVVPAQAQQSTKPVPSKQLEAFIGSRLGTTSIDAYPQFADGKLFACIVEFNSIVRDDVYRVGSFIKVFGSFGLMSAKNNIAVTLKIVVHDFDVSTGALTPSAPANGYFVFGNETSKPSLVAKYPSDVPGALFSVFNIEPTFAKLVSAVDGGKVTFAFNRKDGSADIRVPLDLTVKDTNVNGQKTYSQQMVLDFYQCNRDLLKALR